MGNYLKIGIMVGVDGLGKTPLLNLMLEQDKRAVVRKTTPKDSPGQNQIEVANREVALWSDPKVALQDKILLYDRFPWPDDWVYSFLRGGESAVLGTHAKLERELFENRVRYILIYPGSWEDYIAQKEENPDPSVPPEYIPTLRWKYEAFVERTKQLAQNYPQKIGVRLLRVRARQFTAEDARAIMDWVSPDRIPQVTGRVCPVCETGMLFWRQGGLFCSTCKHKVEDCCEGAAQ